MPVKSGNDANVAALGEMWQGGGKGYKNLVMVTLGTGVGGGIILNEKDLDRRAGRWRRDRSYPCDGRRERGLQLRRPWLPGAGCFRDRDRENCKKNAGGGQPSIQPQKLKEYQREECAGCSKAGDELALDSLNKSCYYLGWVLQHCPWSWIRRLILLEAAFPKPGHF